MSVALQVKVEAVECLHGLFLKNQTAYLLDFKKCKCKDLTSLRRGLMSSGARLSIVKNKLAKRAVVGTSAVVLSDMFVGPTAIVWSESDPVTPAKVLSSFLKDREDLRLKGGVVDGKVVGPDGLASIASMPSKEQVQANLLAQVNAPAVQLLRTFNAPAEHLLRLLDAWRKKLES